MTLKTLNITLSNNTQQFSMKITDYSHESESNIRVNYSVKNSTMKPAEG